MLETLRTFTWKSRYSLFVLRWVFAGLCEMGVLSQRCQVVRVRGGDTYLVSAC